MMLIRLCSISEDKVEKDINIVLTSVLVKSYLFKLDKLIFVS